VRFHPKFIQLATSGEDGEIKLWDAEDGSCEKTMMGHEDSVQSICYDPSGTKLASCSADLSLRLWDLETKVCTKRILDAHEHNISCVIFSTDGKYLISCSRDKTIKIWDVVTGVSKKTLTGHQEWVRSLCMAPSGEMFASCSLDQTVRLWDMATGACLQTFEGHTMSVEAVVFSNAKADEIIVDKLLKGETRTAMRQKLTEQKEDKTKAMGGMFLASSSRDMSIKLWNVDTGEEVMTLNGHTNWVQSLVFHPHGRFLLSASDDKSIRCWDMAEGGQEARVLENAHEMFVVSVDWPKNLMLFASGACDKTIKIWECV
jgi:platelet-activating factor acetylhydrolase IB subunit alpha